MIEKEQWTLLSIGLAGWVENLKWANLPLKAEELAHRTATNPSLTHLVNTAREWPPGEGLGGPYFNLMGTPIQVGGPQLTPSSIPTPVAQLMHLVHSPPLAGHQAVENSLSWPSNKAQVQQFCTA